LIVIWPVDRAMSPAQMAALRRALADTETSKDPEAKLPEDPLP
jgi:hypothetical protein